MRKVLVLVCVLALAGCQFKTKWRDTTGQSRTREQAQIDSGQCDDASGYASLNKNSTYADLDAFKEKMFACMTNRGWELVHDNGEH
jgi:hypothetical protein